MAIPVDILKTTNENLGLIDNLLGKNQAESFYNYFYNAFLTTANSLPINSLWIAFIDKVPIEHINNTLTKFENFQNSINISNTRVAANYESKRNRGGLIIAQSVKLTGEGFDTKRLGYNSNSPGFIKGIVGDGRKDMTTLSMSFLETNVSFVDYVLRPWLIAATHKSLKDPNLKTNITVWHLSKMGPRKNMVKRKVTVYQNCVPVSIDDQEYNYTGGDVYLKRNVDFAFEKYYIDELDSTLLNLIGKPDDPKGLFDKIFEDIKGDLQRAFGASSLTEYANNLVDKAKAFGSDLISGTISGIVTNTAGALTDTVNEAIQGLEGSVRQGAGNAVSSLNNAVNGAINSITGGGTGNSLSPAAFNNSLADSTINADQARRLSSINTRANFKAVNINKNDVPKFSVQNQSENEVSTFTQQDTNIKPDPNDVPFFDDVNKRVKKTGNQDDDTVRFNTPLKHKEVKIDRNDYVRVNTNLKTTLVKPAKNDTPNSLSIPVVIKQIEKNDVR